MKELLKFDNVSKSFFTKDGKTDVLSSISFSLYENQIIAVIGPSGCGKSTILNIASKLEDITSGDLAINAKLGYMFQRDNLFMWRNVFDNIKLGLEINKNITKENIEYVENLIKEYGL